MIEKIKIGLNNLYLFKNKNDEYLLLDTGVNVKKKKILKKSFIIFLTIILDYSFKYLS